MTDQRASRGRIRPVALAVIRDGPRLLVRRYETPDSDRYYRPLGGAVEFGERAAQTAIRELREEIGAEIENVRYLATLENLFERDGQPGHQIVFLFDADFADRSHYAAELIIGTESNGKRIEAVWVDVSQPLDGPLYPEGLLELLTAAPPVNCSSGFPGKSALPPRQMPQTVVSPASDGAHLSDKRPSRDRIRLLALAVIRDGPRLLVQTYKSPNGNRF